MDGWRMLAAKEGHRDVKLMSRNGRDHTARVPGIVEASWALEGSLILDGEVAIQDQQLVSLFEWLRASPRDEVAAPPMFIAFDCLQLDQDDLRSQPLRLRRVRLETVLDGAPAVLLPVRRPADHGLKAWREVLEHGYESLGAKDPESPYIRRPDAQSGSR